VNFPRFVAEFPEAVHSEFTKIDAIARRNSRVTANQFASFCRTVGAPLREAPRDVAALFDRDLVEEVFEAREVAFNSRALRAVMEKRLAESGVDVRLGETVRSLRGRDDGTIVGDCEHSGPVVADRAFICLYSGINTLLRASELPPIPMKHEVAEIALVEPTARLRGLGITLMDGPFFSTMPFPAENLHSFTHVRYTPHEAWRDAADHRNPYRHVDEHRPESQFPLMLRDSVRYMPSLSQVRYSHSLFEPKTVLIESEDNDGRPILHRANHGLTGLTVILGGKLDNIYDILGRIDAAGA
jgi:glycine/D-amino acid oxidase-like deaminating enzyme